jgi:hypothetical protein
MRQRSGPVPASIQVLAVACLAALSLTAGCYEHVVRVEGPGSDAYDTHEPNYKPEEDPFASKPKQKDKVPSQKYEE